MTYLTLAILMARILMAFRRKDPDTTIPDENDYSIRRVFHPAEFELRIPEWR